jgi:hypothetical protein
MPIEIKELIIRAVAEPGPQDALANAQNRAVDADANEALIQACVKEVLKILKQSRER